MFTLKHARKLRKKHSFFNCLIFQGDSRFVYLYISYRCTKAALYDLLRILWEHLPADASFRRVTRRFNSCCKDDGPIWCTSEKTAGWSVWSIQSLKGKTKQNELSIREKKRTQIKIRKSVDQIRPPRSKCAISLCYLWAEIYIDCTFCICAHDTHVLVYGFTKCTWEKRIASCSRHLATF